MGKALNVDDWKSISKLGDMQAAAKRPIWEMMREVKESLHEGPYTKGEVVQILELKGGVEELEELVAMPEEVKSLDNFELFKRAYHVYSEAKRVYDFKMICDKAAAVSNDSSMVCRNILELLIGFFNSDIDTVMNTQY